jgi:muconolactone delta-isomerase
MSGAVGLVLLVQAGSAKELDDLITSMPVWPQMETEVTPLTTFWGAGADRTFQAGATQDANEKGGMSCV